jgi:hypothetical protein
MQSIPYLSKKVPAKITPFGEEKTKSTGSIWKDALNNYLNPGYLSIYQPGRMSKAVRELAAYNPRVLPRVPAKNFTVDGERYHMAGPSYQEWSEILGRNTDAAIADSITSPEYQILEDWERAEKVAQAVDRAFEKSKVDFLELKLGRAVKTPVETEENIMKEFNRVNDFKGLPNKIYIKYDEVQYELSDEDAINYLKALETETTELKRKVVVDGVPLNKIKGYERKYCEGRDGKKVDLDKAYSTYSNFIRNKILDKIEEGVKKDVKESMRDGIIERATAKYVSDPDIEKAIDASDFSTNRWVRIEE